MTTSIKKQFDLYKYSEQTNACSQSDIVQPDLIEKLDLVEKLVLIEKPVFHLKLYYPPEN